MISGPDRLRDWIKRSKVNQNEAAEILGTHPVMLSQWLNGRTKPSLTSAVKIELITGISVESWVLSAVSTETNWDGDDRRKSLD